MAKITFNVAAFTEDFGAKGIKGESKTGVTLPSGHKMSLAGHIAAASDEALAALTEKQVEAVKVTAPKAATESGAVIIKSGKFTPQSLAAMLRRATGLAEVAQAVEDEQEPSELEALVDEMIGKGATDEEIVGELANNAAQAKKVKKVLKARRAAMAPDSSAA